MRIERLNFNAIKNIWGKDLWPNRSSAIETHSAMTWPFEGDPEPIDMNIFNYPATFWGAYLDNKLVGVNSGHKTTDELYRSRGIWVDPEYRKRGVSQMLFLLTAHQAKIEGCEILWSIPKKIALPAYTKFGFETVGDYIVTETSEANIYVKLTF
jgi:GNAT superfamily N-acetyltransferase|tara:strand:+ start:1647 stop:2108 length:462 start_codon:yes stop_codon:yes gene_type:complete